MPTRLSEIPGSDVQVIDDSITFDDIMKNTFLEEGGYTVDHAGPTNFGIVQSTYDQYAARNKLPPKDVKTLTQDEAKKIYFDDYYTSPGYDKLPSRVSGVIFDYGVNAGQQRATKALQSIVGTNPDGKIGKQTIQAVNDFIEKNGEDALVSKIIDNRQKHYDKLVNTNPEKYKKYKNGWDNRIKRMRDIYEKVKDSILPSAEAADDVGIRLSDIEGEEEIVAEGNEQDVSDFESVLIEEDRLKKEQEQAVIQQQIEQQVVEQQRQNDPTQWTLEETKKKFKETPAQSIQEEAQRELLLEQKKSQKEQIKQEIVTQAVQEQALQEIENQSIRLTDIQNDTADTGIRLSDVEAEPKKNDEFSKMSPLMKAVDIANRPAYAVKSLISQIQEQNPKDINEFVSGIPEDIKAAIRGFSGEERKTFEDLLDNAGIKTRFPGFGLAGEMALDPLTYLGPGIVKQAGKVVGPIIKGAMKSAEPVILKTGQVAAQALDKAQEASPAIKTTVDTLKKSLSTVKTSLDDVSKTFKKAFINTTGIPQLDELVKKHTLNKDYLTQKEMQYAIQVRKAIEQISKKTGASIDDISTEIVNLIETPGKVQATLPGTASVANVLKSHFSNILTKEMKAGLPIAEWANVEKGIEYFPRITSAEAKAYLKSAQIGNSKVWNPKLANALSRKTGDFTLKEFNDFVAENGLQSLGGKSVQEFFMKNPAYAVATRGTRSVKAVTSKEFLDDIGRTFGIDADKAPAFFEEAPESLQKTVSLLKGKKFDPEVIKEINRVYTKVLNPEETSGFVKMFDTVQNYWKSWTLSPFPKYHIRNMVGNLWNNYLADVTDPADYLKATKLQLFTKTGNAKVLGDLSEQEARNIITDAEKLGVIGHGWFGSDIPQAVESAVKGTSKNILSPEGPIIRGGKEIGTALENNARLAHYINKIKSGLSPEEAALSVKKYLFDYNDLTVFEKQVMKRMFPFYTWTRKNIPLQIETLMTKPYKLIPLGKEIAKNEQSDITKLEIAKPYIYERLPIPIKKDEKNIVYMPLEGLIPSADLAKMVRPQEIAIELLSPYIKTPIELGINKSFYSEQEIEKYPKETQEFLRQDIPVKWKYALTSVFPQARMLSEINRILKKKETDDPLTKDEVAVQTAVTTLYKENLDDLSLKAMQKIKYKVTDLRKAFNWAVRKGREKEAERIMKTIEETLAELEKID